MENTAEGATPKLVGARVLRREDQRFLTGQGVYVDDYRPSGLLHAAFLRSPYAHARLGRIETANAQAMPGVVAVMTGADLARVAKPVRAKSRMSQYRETGFPPLALDKVRYVGEAVAVVVAESRYVAEDALEEIVVDYEPLAAVADAMAARASGEPETVLLHDEAESNVLLAREFSQGDAEAAMAQADVRVRDRFRFHRHAVVCMENRGCVAEFHLGSGELTLRSATQCPGLLRDALADLLDMPEHLVRVIAPDVGGGFGAKSSLYPEEITVCALARMLSRPVKWISDRREDLLTSTQAWDEVVEAELALRADGTIIGLRAEVTSDIGAYSIYPWTASVEPIQAISFLSGPYRVPHYAARVRGVATCKAPMGPYRGVGRPVTTFVMEGLMDRAARQLGMDPVALRLHNYIREEDFPYRTPSGIVWDQASLTPCMDQAVEALDYAGLQAWRSQVRAEGRWAGIGFATYIELTGVGSAIPASPGASISTGTEAAFLRADPSGTVTAAFSLAPQGQGNETTLAQVVADELGVRLQDVRVVCGDTAIAPHGSGTYASRSAVLAGGAAILAGRDLRAKALQIAAHLLEANPDDLDLQQGRVSVQGSPDRGVSFREVAQAAYGGRRRLPPDVEPGLEVTRFYDPYYGTASSATHVVAAEVDRETYEVTLHRYVVVEDCGRLINPLIVDGQVRGGVAQGIGAALYEEVIYDPGGQLLSGTLMDYLVPSAAEVIKTEIHHLETPSPTTLGGFRGMGEGIDDRGTGGHRQCGVRCAFAVWCRDQ
ncbi:xanthine dehydrogenase family protein molybdopterin-binding subunit [Candidatus Entotheonella palauensis]|uniref:xanthine dehydrogenase family protein molybdopterin-binding subunit n=1 Tax=Candidatus Entotheonella palauensis TaxID=93172 RepID=UPI00277B5A4C|nr:xanthine dehydrogenase family protein molybdopterin-binding subunit [Candidatus Entotheonella palauensis]